MVEQKHHGSQVQEKDLGCTEVGNLWERIGKLVVDNSETME